MKKILTLFWFGISTFVFTFCIFKSGDEIYSRREILFTGILILIGSSLLIILLRHISESKLNAALYLSMFLSVFFCLWLEKNHPVLIIPPEEISITIPSANDGKVSLTWAYWSKPGIELNDEVDDWSPFKELSNNMIQFTGNWNTEDRISTCSGTCDLKVSTGLHFHRPVLCFEGNALIDILKADEIFTVQSGIPLRFFTGGTGLSRQFVFVILFLCSWGVLYFPIAGLIHILPIHISSHSSNPDSDLLIYLVSFLFPIFILVLICFLLKILPFGEKTFLLTDMQVQYADYLIYLKQIILGKRSLFYSFSKSIGDDFLSLYAYYLGNPLNWITALFPVEDFPKAVSIIVIARYGLCGLTAAVYFRKIFQTKGETVVFSTAYALISLQFMISEHIQLRDGAILLPLILLGIEQLLFQNRIHLYIITLCSALLISYYSAYQICFYCVLYAMFRLLMAQRWSWKQAGRFMGASLISALLCAFFLIPVAVQLTKGMKTFDPAQFTLTLNMRFSELAGKLFNSAFDMDQTLTSGLPNIFCGLFVTSAIPLFFLNGSISRKEKLLTGTMLILFTAVMQIRALNLILHGFNEPVWWPYRYSFIICMFLITIALRCYQERSGVTIKAWRISAAMIIALLLYVRSQEFSWFSADAFYLNLVLNFSMLILWLISPYIKAQQFYFLILILSSLDLLSNGWMILGEKTAYQRTETASDFREFFDTNQPVLAALENSDSDFYRIEKTYFRDANDAMTLGYHGVSHYSSTLNYNVMKFLPKMGYRYYPWRFLYGEGSDLAADSLLGIRYLISDQNEIQKKYDKILTENGKTVLKNPFSLPIAFFARDIQAKDPEEITFELQNGIFKALTGENTPIYSRIDSSSPLLNNLTASDLSENRYERIIETDEASITWTAAPDTGKNLYLFLRNDSDDLYPVSIYINGEYLTEYFDGRGMPIIQIPDTWENSEIEITLVPKNNAVCFTEMQIYSENTDVLEQYTGMLGNSSISVRKESETSVSGEIAAAGDGYLFFSIPYDKGWKIMIDGSEIVSEQAFDVFLSAPVSTGNHTFKIKFIPEGLVPGAIISAGTILILILNAIRKKHHSSGEVHRT